MHIFSQLLHADAAVKLDWLLEDVPADVAEDLAEWVQKDAESFAVTVTTRLCDIEVLLCSHVTHACKTLDKNLTLHLNKSFAKKSLNFATHKVVLQTFPKIANKHMVLSQFS